MYSSPSSVPRRRYQTIFSARRAMCASKRFLANKNNWKASRLPTPPPPPPSSNHVSAHPVSRRRLRRLAEMYLRLIGKRYRGTVRIMTHKTGKWHRRKQDCCTLAVLQATLLAVLNPSVESNRVLPLHRHEKLYVIVTSLQASHSVSKLARRKWTPRQPANLGERTVVKTVSQANKQMDR